MPLPIIIAAVTVAGLGIPLVAQARAWSKLTPEEREARLAHAVARREEFRGSTRKKISEWGNRIRERKYLEAIAGPQLWCLLAMREGRNYTRQWVDRRDMPDVEAWAEANGISVTEMELTKEKARLSFGDLRKARKTARFMGEKV